MHAYLLIGSGRKEIDNEIKRLVGGLKVYSLEFPLQKIEDVRVLNSFTNLKVDKPTAIIINDFHLATVPAQNAFLKNLEEPQEDLYYILVSASEKLLLPTIASRCLIIKITGTHELVDTKAQMAFLNHSTEGKLEIIDKIKKREEAIEFTQNLLAACHLMFHQTEEGRLNLARFAKKIGQTRKHLKANGNVNIQLTDLVVNLSGK